METAIKCHRDRSLDHLDAEEDLIDRLPTVRILLQDHHHHHQPPIWNAKQMASRHAGILSKMSTSEPVAYVIGSKNMGLEELAGDMKAS
jgi:hypothetical protein